MKPPTKIGGCLTLVRQLLSLNLKIGLIEETITITVLHSMKARGDEICQSIFG